MRLRLGAGSERARRSRGKGEWAYRAEGHRRDREVVGEGILGVEEGVRHTVEADSLELGRMVVAEEDSLVVVDHSLVEVRVLAVHMDLDAVEDLDDIVVEEERHNLVAGDMASGLVVGIDLDLGEAHRNLVAGSLAEENLPVLRQSFI